MKINILLPGNTTHPSGGYKIVYEYCNKLVANGHIVTINYLYGPMFEKLPISERLRKILIKIYSEAIGPGRWFTLDKKIKLKVLSNPNKMENADIVIATAVRTADIVNELPKSCGKKVYFIQDFENWNRTDEEVYASYNLRMTNIVVAKWLKNIVDAHSKKPSHLVSNCINTEVFNDKGLERRKHSIVFHYRSADYKGSKYAIEVIKMLEEKYPDLKVDVISIEDAPDNLPKSCKFHHKLNAEEIAEINNTTQVFMCTSVEEGFGLPGLEAMACGCAVVSTSYRGVLEYAVDGENALLSPVRDVEAMVNNIVRLFEDEELREKISENGIKTGKERSLETSAQKFEKVLLGVLIQNGR